MPRPESPPEARPSGRPASVASTDDRSNKFGIAAERSSGQTGVWTNGRKIASIGVHAREWVTWHGFALNVSTNLSFFDLMVPCGIAGVSMTSIERERAAATSIDHVADSVVDAFSQVFDLAAHRAHASVLSAAALTR